MYAQTIVYAISNLVREWPNSLSEGFGHAMEWAHQDKNRPQPPIRSQDPYNKDKDICAWIILICSFSWHGQNLCWPSLDID